MENALGRKLRLFCDLAPEDLEALRSISSVRKRRYGSREDLLIEGDNQARLYVLLEGWACRYKQMKDGRRQLVALFLPGDMCERHATVLATIDHSMGALTPATFAEVDPSTVEAICERHPRICRAMLFSTLANLSIQREWTLNVGQRDAPERIGHLFCEIYFRQRALGLTDDRSCPMPLTQSDIADATGMTSVHVNRSIQALRRDGLIQVRGKRLTILDLDRLMRTSLFEPNYLHLGHDPRPARPERRALNATMNGAKA